MCFEASQAVFWSLSCYKELKLITKPFTGRTLRGLLIQMQNISLRSSGMRRKQNFEFQGLEVTVVWTFTFHFISSPLFLLFLPHFFFSAEHLVGFILVGKSFQESFQDLGIIMMTSQMVERTWICMGGSGANGLRIRLTYEKFTTKQLHSPLNCL